MTLKKRFVTLTAALMFAALVAFSTNGQATASAEMPAALAAPGALSAASTATPAASTVFEHRRRICSDRATLRLNPVAGSQELTTVYRGDFVYIRPVEFYRSGAWVLVRTEGLHGEFKVTGWILAHHFC
jgi:hypothetical protein